VRWVGSSELTEQYGDRRMSDDELCTGDLVEVDRSNGVVRIFERA
jgi:hypothetical protein